MTQWAAEVLLALRAAGWPEPVVDRAGYLGYATSSGMVDLCKEEVRVISISDHVRIAGPPRAVAQTLSYWRDIAG